MRHGRSYVARHRFGRRARDGSALGSTLAARLPAQTGATDDPTGNAPIAQCALFASGYTWGAVKRADVTIGGKTAGNMPIQVIGDDAYATPADCLPRGGTARHGGRARRERCDRHRSWGARIPGVALTPPAGGLLLLRVRDLMHPNTRVPLDTQVMNPVANFTSDNNGTIIRLPALPADGQASGTGELVFGVGTRQNNALPSTASILPLDNNSGFTADYNGRSLSWSTAARTSTTSWIRQFRTQDPQRVTSIRQPRRSACPPRCKLQAEPARLSRFLSRWAWLQHAEQSATPPTTASARRIREDSSGACRSSSVAMSIPC